VFGKSRQDDGEPTLGQAWQTLGQRLGLSVDSSDPRAVHAEGVVCGRRVVVDISSKQRGSEFFAAFKKPGRGGNRAYLNWSSSLSVACTNPRGLTGSVESIVDITDPSWKPGNFDPLHCRVVRASTPELAAVVLTPSVRDRLMQWVTDARFEVQSDRVVLAEDARSRLDSGYVAGSIVHRFVGSPPPWPERALIGPQWWVDLLVDVADALDA
jgi:hypothetical protein